MSIHVMSYEVGAFLEDDYWQAPVYCFDGDNPTSVVRELTTAGLESDPLRRWLNSLEASLVASSTVAA